MDFFTNIVGTAPTNDVADDKKEEKNEIENNKNDVKEEKNEPQNTTTQTSKKIRLVCRSTDQIKIRSRSDHRFFFFGWSADQSVWSGYLN